MKNLIIDFIRQIANKDMEVARGVLLAGRVGLISPVDSDLLCDMSASTGATRFGLKTYGLMNATSIQGLHGSLSGPRVIIFNEPIVEALCLVNPGQCCFFL